jgi:hypothetical protein
MMGAADPRSAMQWYNKRPMAVRAMQYTKKSRDKLIAILGEACVHTAIDDDGGEYELQNLRINTLEGPVICRPGWWVIEGVKGEFYCCEPEIFKLTYSMVDPNESDQGKW